MQDVKKMTTYELIKELSRMEREIDMLCLEYEKVRLEMVSRYPQVANDEVFEPKTVKIKK